MMMNTPGLQPEKNSWFAERRHLFTKNMIKGFYETFSRFRTIYEHYTVGQKLDFGEIDHLVGSESKKGRLWQLKDRCHELWRDADPQFEFTGCLLDWVLGSIFHEAMKLKENIYMLEFYGPLAETMREKQQATSVMFCGEECRRFMDRTRTEIHRQVESLGFMFGRANFLLRSLLLEQSGNPLLARYLVEHPEVPEDLWSETLEALFSDMFPSGPEYGFCTAARSYQEGHWFHSAHEAYERALAINPACDEAKSRIYQLRGLVREQERLLKPTAI